jgi:hypothetical protein
LSFDLYLSLRELCSPRRPQRRKNANGGEVHDHNLQFNGCAIGGDDLVFDPARAELRRQPIRFGINGTKADGSKGQFEYLPLSAHAKANKKWSICINILT